MKEKIVNISLWEELQLLFLSFIYGLYLILGRFMKWAWDPKKFFVMQQRGTPPSCLVDETLGKHSYVKLKGIKFHYVEAGDKDKPVLLLLHGFPDCWFTWREQIPVLAKHFRVIALDLKGFGDSDKPLKRRAYKIDILIDELKQFVFALGVKSCSIIGHDLGALLGWYMLALHEDMINKFIAISCPHPNLYWNSAPKDAILDGKWLHFSRLPFLPEIDALKEDLSIITETYRHLQVNDSSDAKNYVEAYKYAFSRKEDWTGPINYYRNLPFTRLSINSSEPITTRSLLIVGNLDSSVSLESMIQSTEFMEKCNLKVIPGAHHFPHQEEAATVNKNILKFLIGTPNRRKKTPEPQRSIVSSWLGSLSSTVKYGNQMLDAVQKRTNGVVSELPNKVLYLRQAST